MDMEDSARERITAEIRARAYESLSRFCVDLIEREARRLRSEGYIEGYRVIYNPVPIDRERGAMSARNEVEFLLPYGGGVVRHAIGDDEIRMVVEEGFRQWMLRVSYDVVNRSRAVRGDTSPSASPMLSPQLQELFRRQVEDQLRFRGDFGYGTFTRKNPIDERAEARARDLFVAVAGREPFDRLESGRPVFVLGSEGGRYHLRKKASFCVQALNTGQSLCAVVPGVPLYDHLLGIKLMIEHDEQRFLGTANSSVDFPVVPGRIIWQNL